ncbi:MAG: hypothetical protein AAF573_04165 [Bacteroidota bacterium]
METAEKLQLLILDQRGEIIFSDNTLFSIGDLPSTSVFDWSPFVESIFPNLFQTDQKIYTFRRVKTIHPFLTGTYDYFFYKNEKRDLSCQIIWWIVDRSVLYDKMTAKQQHHQQQIIANETVAFQTPRIS